MPPRPLTFLNISSVSFGYSQTVSFIARPRSHYYTMSTPLKTSECLRHAHPLTVLQQHSHKPDVTFQHGPELNSGVSGDALLASAPASKSTRTTQRFMVIDGGNEDGTITLFIDFIHTCTVIKKVHKISKKVHKIS